jgi:transcriptional regulator with XRE-family HTH domain
MRCQTTEVGVLLRAARVRHGLSQRRLALRAGTSQDAISRIERGAESPTFERLRELLLVMGEQPVLTTVELGGSRNVEGPAEVDRLTPRERLFESASWNLVATRLELAGVAARKRAGTERDGCKP